MNFKSVLSQDNSVVVGAATAGMVFGIYNFSVGPISSVHMTPANDTNVAASLKKAGWISLATVAGLVAITKDLNIAILGGGTIILEELSYRHAAMADEKSGMISVTPADYQQAPTYQSEQQQTSY